MENSNKDLVDNLIEHKEYLEKMFKKTVGIPMSIDDPQIKVLIGYPLDKKFEWKRKTGKSYGNI